MNLLDAFFFQAALDPTRPALAYPGGLATYGALARAANVAASNLIDLGVQPGDVCAIRIRDPLLHLAVLLGLGRIGAVSLSLPDRKPLGELDLKVAARLTDRQLEGDVAERVVIVDSGFYSQARASCVYSGQIKGYQGTRETLVAICLSSGSTGRPKQIGLTAGLLEFRFGYPLGEGASARVLNMMGLDTIGGHQVAIEVLRAGGLICFAPGAPLTLEMVGFFGVTILMASPDQLQALLAEQREKARSAPSLRTMIIGGAHLPAAAQLDAERLFGARIMICYGSTEVGLAAYAPSTLLPVGSGTFGYPAPWLDIEIVDHGDRPSPVGQEGLIRIRGNGVVGGYLKPADEDAAVFRDGWFYPGDLGRLDADGLLHVTGRLGTRINRGGVKLAPESIEEVLGGHAGVRECAVGAVATLDGNVRILAALVFAEASVDAEELRAFCQARIPDRVPDDFFEVQAIPRTSLGKIAREPLADLLRAHYAAES